MTAPRISELVVFVVGVAAAVFAGAYSYRSVGPFGDGAFGGNFYWQDDAATGKAILYHESNTSNGRTRQVLDAQYKVREIRVDTKRDGTFEQKFLVNGNELTAAIDTNHDGRIERWEHYDLKGALTRTGESSRGDGVEDTWTYPDASGQISRVEMDLNRDGILDQRQIFAAGPGGKGRVIVAAESEFDKSGAPGFRIRYKPDGSFEKSEILRSR